MRSPNYLIIITLIISQITVQLSLRAQVNNSSCSTPHPLTIALNQCTPATVPYQAIITQSGLNTCQGTGYDIFYSLTPQYNSVHLNLGVIPANLLTMSLKTSCNGQEIWCSNVQSFQNFSIATNPGQSLILQVIFDGRSPGPFELCFWEAPCAVTANIVSIPAAICKGESAQLTASASGGHSPYQFQWNQGLGSGPSKTVAPLETTTYQVTVTDRFNCTATASFTLTVHPEVEVMLQFQKPICGLNNGWIEAIAQGGNFYAYLWSNGETSARIENLSDGLYSVTVTANTRCVGTASAVLTRSQPLMADARIIEASCPEQCNGRAGVDAFGGDLPYQIQWSNGNSGEMALDLCPGRYLVTVTDVNGCTATSVIEMTVLDTLVITFFGDNLICEGDTGFLRCLETYDSYLWSNGATAPFIEWSMPGEYSLTVTKGPCIASRSISLNWYPALILSFIFENGILTVIVDGDAEPYTFEWSSGETTESISVEEPGIYTVTIFDGNGCQTTASFDTEASSIYDYQIPCQWSIFPNPASKTLNIKSDYTILQVLIIDDSGQYFLMNLQSNTIDINHLKPGKYFILPMETHPKRCFTPLKFVKFE